MPHVIVLGSSNTDMVIRCATLPQPGQTVLGGEFYMAAGGKGANQAVAAARAGAQVTFLGALGDDLFGHEALKALNREGIETRHVRTLPGAASGTALIFVDERGENLIGVAAGANGRLTPADIDRLPADVFQTPGIFVVQLETPLETVRRGLERARAAGLNTILNPAPADPRAAAAEFLQGVDLLTPNESEASILTGLETSTPSGVRRAARALQARGVRRVIVTLGAAGCLVVDETETLVPAPAVQAVDAVAAGDAFNGALACSLAEGRSLLDAAHWATRAAAISVTRRGAQPSLATRAEIERFWDG